jgi:GNAT superfamily N-acetyltransferase
VTLLVSRAHTGEPQIIATGSYLAKDKQTAEVAFAVDDAFQHQGLGTLLLRRLASLAAQHGFTRFWAVTQADNQTMRDVFLESGFALEEKTQGSEVEVHLALVASPTPVT